MQYVGQTKGKLTLSVTFHLTGVHIILSSVSIAK